jgi:hypothetical protein
VQHVGRVALALVVGASSALVLVASWAAGSDFVLLVGETVVQPVDVSLGLWATGVLGSAGSTALVVLRRRRPTSGRGDRRALLGAALAAMLVGTGVWCAGHAAVVGASAALGPHAFTVLPASAGDGCTLVAHESGALRSTLGQVYVADELGYARPAGSWVADEIDLPIRDGRYSLQWRGESGTLSVRAAHATSPERLHVTCAH